MSTQPSIKQIIKPINAGIVHRKNPCKNEKKFVLTVDGISWFHEVLSIFSATCIRVKTVLILPHLKQWGSKVHLPSPGRQPQFVCTYARHLGQFRALDKCLLERSLAKATFVAINDRIFGFHKPGGITPPIWLIHCILVLNRDSRIKNHSLFIESLLDFLIMQVFKGIERFKAFLSVCLCS